MPENPIDGGAYFRDENGNLTKLEQADYQLDPVTRELKRPSPPKAEQPAAQPKK